jgi:predicted nucleic acid-binding protein
MTGRSFIDSNVWVYLFIDEDTTQQRIAGDFLLSKKETGGLFISWQVVNEVWNTLLKKQVPDKKAREMVEHTLQSCELVDFSYALIVSAHDLRTRHSVSFWDSLVVAAALAADCDVLVSEDMQDGKKFGRLRVKNIFG